MFWANLTACSLEGWVEQKLDDGIWNATVDPVSGNRHYSTLDFGWPDVDAALQAWLAPTNFTDDGVQRRRLQDFRQQANSKL